MTSPRRRPVVLAGAAMALVVGLSGCSSPSAGEARDANPAPQQPQATQAAAPRAGRPAANPSAAVTDQRLVRTGHLTLTVGDVDDAAARVRAALPGLGGQVAGEDVGTTAGGDAHGRLTVKVPADRMDQAMSELAKIGEVVSRTVETEDVTSTYVDTEARITSLRASIQRLRDLIARAKDLTEVTGLERELSTREADLDSLQAQLTSLKGRVALSTITVELATNPPAPAEPDRPGFMTGLRSGWNGTLAFLSGLLALLGWLVPTLIPLAILGLPVAAVALWLRRRHRARAAARPAAMTQAMPPQPPVPAAPAPVTPTPPAPTPPSGSSTPGTRPEPPTR